MKKKIAILGSTGSIGVTTLNIVKKKENLILIDTLIAKSNYKKIIYQIKRFKPKKFIIEDLKTYLKIKKNIKTKTKLFCGLEKFSLNQAKYDMTVSAVPGIAGLKSTIFFTKNSKQILLANKESIICGWSLIKKISKKNNCKIIPLDSEHFSIYQLIKDKKDNEIDKIFITASGGPFLFTPLKKFKNITPKDALKHPKWNMGKKISIDSATLMNKIFELIEAQKIFNIDKEKFEIVIHPQSLVHAIVRFKNGITKFLYHETDMTIPIANAIFNSSINIKNFLKTKKNEDVKKLEFFKVDKSRFPAINIVPKLNKFKSTPIIINAANEILVDQFLKRKIRFNSIFRYLYLVLRDKNYKKYAIQSPNNIKSIFTIDQWSRDTTLGIIKMYNKLK